MCVPPRLWIYSLVTCQPLAALDLYGMKMRDANSKAVAGQLRRPTLAWGNVPLTAIEGGCPSTERASSYRTMYCNSHY